MNLLFKQETFSAEFKRLLGFVDADVRFARLQPALNLATAEVVDLISPAQYEAVFNEEASAEFIHLVKYAVALKAYIIYAPTSDVSVTNNGRVVRRDEHQVSAYQWQLEDNDEALENLYYRHLDGLLRYMAEHQMAVNLEKYKHSHLLIHSLNIFEAYFNIEQSHLLYLKLLPALREFDLNEALPRLGEAKFKVLLSEKEQSPLLYNLQNAAVCYAMDWGIRRLNIRLFPKGVLQTSKASNQGKKQEAAAKLEYWEAAKLFNDDFRKSILKVEKIIAEERCKANENKAVKLSYPDLNFNCSDGFVDV